MQDIIHLLPDTIANQIAAGEVVQRPSSVIKELMENSVDAGATQISVNIVDAGRTLIQVTDNGKGMSAQDAVTSFQRHATSKISSIEDLSVLNTMGFRGEALASIAAVAQVELRTKRPGDELGTMVAINGGDLIDVQEVSCPVGSNFQVKNLFYNIPGRRKFLKSDNVEFNHLDRNFARIVLVYPEIEFSLYNNGKLTYALRPGSFKERITGIFGKNVAIGLLPVNVSTTMVEITGYVGRPETAKKRNDRQMFFVNGRFMDHPYFRRAVLQAYDRLLPEGLTPDFFLYLTVDPHTVDVNVSPTKTEIKFENEQHIYPIINAVVKEALGKYNITSPMDFEHDTNDDPIVRTPKKGDPITPPVIPFDPTYTPFGDEGQKTMSDLYDQWKKKNQSKTHSGQTRDVPSSIGKNKTNIVSSDSFDLSSIMELEDSDNNQYTLFESDNNISQFMQLHNKYIVTISPKGLLCIDQRRAHIRVLFNKYRKELEQKDVESQEVFFPLELDLSPSQMSVVEDIIPVLNSIGFGITLGDNGRYVISSIPIKNSIEDKVSFITNIIDALAQGETHEIDRVKDEVALTLARTNAISSTSELGQLQMKDIVSQLFKCDTPALTPDGKRIFTLLSDSEIERRL